MAKFWLSFCIEFDDAGGRPYEARYTDFTRALAPLKARHWAESTNFMLFESGYPIEQIAATAKAAFAPSKDVFLIHELDAPSAIACGNIHDQNLFVLMPYAKKL